MIEKRTQCGIFLLAGGLLLLAAPRVRAQPSPALLWSYHGIENVVSCGWIPDIDGDGGPDVLFESYDAGAPTTDHIFAIRGRSSGTGARIWSARPLGGPSNSGGWGDNCLRVSPDQNGDGFPEVLLGAAWGSRTAFALDGRTGSTYWKFDTYAQSPPTPPESGWVYAMASLGSDLDGDGVPEAVFCTGSNNDGIYCLSGRTGQVIWRYFWGDASYDILSIDDLDGDGVRDVIVGAGDNLPGVLALSGRGAGGGAGRLLWSRTTGTVWSVARLQDITGDGIPEVVAASWDNQIHCLNGVSGVPVWATPADYGQRVAALDDVNSDGIEDVAYGSWDNAARVYSGADGGLLWRTQVGTLNGGDVWAIDRVADATGDGINDVCCGSFDYYAYLMNGVSGQIVWRYYTGNRLFTVRGVPDLDGNGVPDVVAGTQMPSGGSGGICYALEGGGSPGGVSPLPAGGFAARLSSGYPNPFTTLIDWDLRVGVPGRVEAGIFEPTGRRIRSLFGPGLKGAGDYRITWDGRDAWGRAVPSGSYYVRLLHDGRVIAERKAVAIR